MTIRIYISLLLAMLVAVGCAPDGASGESAEADVAAAGEAGTDAAEEEVDIMPGLTMRKLKNGYGRAAVAGDLATVHYTGWLYDGGVPDG